MNIEGVGKDVEIVINKNGGKQSKAPMALHLVDPDFLIRFFYNQTDYISSAIFNIAWFMKDMHEWRLYEAIKNIENNNFQLIIRIGKVLQEGAEKYEPNNWRLIPQEEHINHALIHLFAAALGDTQDEHIDHALCRIMMALSTESSKNFNYTKYKDVKDNINDYV